jgi:hypothetical protein
MPDAIELDKHYKALTDQQLLNLKREGGFAAEAEGVLDKELARRNLGTGDLTRYIAAIQRNRLREEVTERGGGYRQLGFQLFGSRYLSEADKGANIEVKTKWFTLSGIPLVPIASYRFKFADSSDERRVIDRVSLDWMQVFQTWIKTSISLIGWVLLAGGIYWILHRIRH